MLPVGPLLVVNFANSSSKSLVPGKFYDMLVALKI